MQFDGGFCIGPWRVSPLTGEIESSDRAVHLEPKVMEVLVVLAENAESVVLRDELLQRIWGARAAISDEPLTRCVAQLRQALGDSPRNPRFIKTVPKRGYCLLVPAEPLTQPQPDQNERTRVPDRKSSPWTLPVGISGVAALLAVVGLVAWFAYPRASDSGVGSIDPCDLESVEAPSMEVRVGARAACERGVELMNLRTSETIFNAMTRFREAVAIQPDYGSALVNLARAMVLYETYSEYPPLAEECWYDENESDQQDCYDAAMRLLDRRTRDAQYIEKYANGIRGYIYAKQRRWSDADGKFRLAAMDTPYDADMWQWNSQLLASTGNIDGALTAIDRAYQLNPTSGVILDRYAVLLMWADRDDESIAMFDAAAKLMHVPYKASVIVSDIRRGRWQEVRRELLNHARVTGVDDPQWIDAFIAGIRDESRRNAAVVAVEQAIARGDLRGQYIYGAWVFLEQPVRAINAAIELLETNPPELDVEFLFARETRPLRQHDDFRKIVETLNLDDYWRDTGYCPELFGHPGEQDWCERV